ncbi:polymorphic toxin-type HINT domain-containing protein [Tuwongella immobilis]|uniref:polymorphic toxin-type HINT domain-containing protein n=1 Tax=Tuwongella immobilis TaxID=692036 RepID=UPI0013A6AAD2
MEARSLTPSHRLRTLDGSALAVEAVTETGLRQPVYNLRVADWHTYFVVGDAWGWAVWAHNAACAGALKEKNGIVYQLSPTVAVV